MRFGTGQIILWNDTLIPVSLLKGNQGFHTILEVEVSGKRSSAQQEGLFKNYLSEQLNVLKTVFEPRSSEMWSDTAFRVCDIAFQKNSYSTLIHFILH